MPKISTSAVEVTHIFPHGFWLLLGEEEELLLPFAQFPWFRQATIEQISTIEWPTPDHLYWPDLDIDLSVQSIRQPEKFPLLAKATI
ncbi:MAG: DUF2442 domain-containing protein [Burkholderiaceae bacterium]|nr:DUF2442 domain-containing protein [Burkholderiaceae bacterium]